jgi:hypothetical protein
MEGWAATLGARLPIGVRGARADIVYLRQSWHPTAVEAHDGPWAYALRPTGRRVVARQHALLALPYVRLFAPAAPIAPVVILRTPGLFPFLEFVFYDGLLRAPIVTELAERAREAALQLTDAGPTVPHRLRRPPLLPPRSLGMPYGSPIRGEWGGIGPAVR